MKSIEISVISTEIIKPSKATPSHLRSFKLSLLDQLIPNPYAPIILFYPPNGVVVTAKKLHTLKTSLSETLTRYYPLAGKIGGDNLSVECNDQGARYVEAKVIGYSLQEFLGQPCLISSLNGLFPCELGFEPSTEFLTNVQVSVFDCGGIALGICISHKLLDGVALSAFLQSWSATCRGGEDGKESMQPCLDAANSLFPAKDLWLRNASMATFGAFFAKGKCVTKRFVFDSEAISILKTKAATTSSPTRVEAVSAFLWKCVAEASEKTIPCGHALSTHVVNMRRRTKPPLPAHSIGNLLWIVPAKSSITGDVDEFAGSLRDSFSKIDADFVENLRGDGMAECLAEIGELRKECLVHVGFSSWCKFGFYEVDFGLGKPVWVSSVGLSGSELFMKLVILVDTKVGDGIEAWVSLDERQLAIVERNSELLILAQVDPNPLSISK